jgi:hypothetical protein
MTVLFLTAIAPIYTKDKYKKEPKLLIFYNYFLGTKYYHRYKLHII